MANIRGTDGKDNLEGQGGADVIHGLKGNDDLHGRAGADDLYGDEGDDTLYGDTGDDHLYGGEGHDRLQGGEGDDVLVGGGGWNILFGGGGSDRFVLNVIAHGNQVVYNEIKDWQVGESIDLRPIDANPNQAGDQAFRFIGHGEFDGRVGEARVEFLGSTSTSDSRTLVEVDVDGDRYYDASIVLWGYHYDFHTGSDLFL